MPGLSIGKEGGLASLVRPMNSVSLAFKAEFPPPATPISAPRGLPSQGEDRPASALPGAPARLDDNQPPLFVVRQVEPSSSPVFEAPLPSSLLLTNILPCDLSSLDSSIKDFFDQIEQFGLKLSDGHIDFLFSSGALAVATALALEITRRKIHAPVAAPALQREGSIPFSDYP